MSPATKTLLWQENTPLGRIDPRGSGRNARDAKRFQRRATARNPTRQFWRVDRGAKGKLPFPYKSAGFRHHFLTRTCDERKEGVKNAPLQTTQQTRPWKKSSILLTIAAGLLSLSAAQANDLSLSGTFNGNFRYNDGTTTSAGTFVETRATTGTTTTESVVYTLTSTGATSTDTTATTTNADESKTVVYTHIAFGATASFTSTVTFAAFTTTTTTNHGSTITRTSASPYGTGTFTAADGTTGTLTTIEADGIAATDLTNATTGLTRELSEEGDGFANFKTYSVSPAGVLAITSLSRVSGHGHH